LPSQLNNLKRSIHFLPPIFKIQDPGIAAYKLRIDFLPLVSFKLLNLIDQIA